MKKYLTLCMSCIHALHPVMLTGYGHYADGRDVYGKCDGCNRRTPELAMCYVIQEENHENSKSES